MTQTAEDAALLMNFMAGFDEKDSTSLNEPVPNYTRTLNDSLKGLRIGLPDEYFSSDLDPDIAATIETAVITLTELSFSDSSLLHHCLGMLIEFSTL